MDTAQQPRHRKHKMTLPSLVVEPEDDAFSTVPVEQMSVRSVFLVVLVFVSLAAFTLFALTELTYHHPQFLLSSELQSNTHIATQWTLLLVVPVTSAASWFSISSPTSPSASSSMLRRLLRRFQRNHLFAVYQSIAWTLYGLYAALQLSCIGSSGAREFLVCQPANRSTQAVAALIAEVIMISSVLTLERRRDRNCQRRKDRFVVQLNNFNNMLLLVGATILALSSEYTRAFPDPSVRYPMATGLGSLALFVTALLNTYGLGGVLSTKDGWSFYQPFVGGARFVLFQAVSWTCFTAAATLQVLYLLSLVVVELEMFVGAMAVAEFYYWTRYGSYRVFFAVLVLDAYSWQPPQFCGRFFMDTVKQYFNGNIIRMAPLDPNKHYVMSFHPHGITPISVIWLQFNAQWRKLFPNFYAHILTASILHQLPLVRDIMHFYGSREVTRDAFAYTLQQKESVMVVPGGQAEMLEQRSGQKEVRVYTHHKGFVRLGIQHGVPLVPILSLKEGEMLDNVQAPMLQRWFVKKVAVPFPFFPYGRALLPFPRKIDIPIVIGEPLEVPHIEQPTHEEVDNIHTKYFAKLEEMFCRYKNEVGCGDYKLVLI